MSVAFFPFLALALLAFAMLPFLVFLALLLALSRPGMTQSAALAPVSTGLLALTCDFRQLVGLLVGLDPHRCCFFFLLFDQLYLLGLTFSSLDTGETVLSFFVNLADVVVLFGAFGIIPDFFTLVAVQLYTAFRVFPLVVVVGLACGPFSVIPGNAITPLPFVVFSVFFLSPNPVSLLGALVNDLVDLIVLFLIGDGRKISAES